MGIKLVSIHAPVKGRHLKGADLRGADLSFNPRPREGATEHAGLWLAWLVFQSTPP